MPIEPPLPVRFKTVSLNRKARAIASNGQPRENAIPSAGLARMVAAAKQIERPVGVKTGTAKLSAEHHRTPAFRIKSAAWKILWAERSEISLPQDWIYPRENSAPGNSAIHSTIAPHIRPLLPVGFAVCAHCRRSCWLRRYGQERREPIHETAFSRASLLSKQARHPAWTNGI
jgi:hypothetical protein